MSIRGGRGPRDEQDNGGTYRNGYHRTGRYGRGPGDQRKYERYGSRNGGIGGILRFVLFLGLLAGGVLLVMVTVARPLVRAVVVPWADDNPAALRIPFVEEMVREDIGAALTKAATGSPDDVMFSVQEGDTPADDRAPARRGGPHRERARVPVRRPPGGAGVQAPGGAVRARGQPHARPRWWTGS